MSPTPVDDSEPDHDNADVPPGGTLPPRDRFTEIDFDAAFADLISQFDRPDANDGPPRAALRDVPRIGEPRQEDQHLAGSSDGAGENLPPLASSEQPSIPAPSESWYPAVLDEHFEPSDPGPLPRGDLIGRLAWAGLLGGPLALILAAVLSGQPSGLMVLAAVVAFLAGFGTLVFRMPADRDDDNDDGAVV